MVVYIITIACLSCVFKFPDCIFLNFMLRKVQFQLSELKVELVRYDLRRTSLIFVFKLKNVMVVILSVLKMTPVCN